MTYEHPDDTDKDRMYQNVETPEQTRERHLVEIAAANRQIEARLDEWGFDVTNVRENQVKFFVDFLVGISAISKEDAQMFFLQWETHLNDTLAGLEMKARQAIADMEKERREASYCARNGLAIPASPSLVLPPGAAGVSGNNRRERRANRGRPPQAEG